MSKLLFDKQPVVVDRDLAKAIGLNESIVLQQLHYWLEINTKKGGNYHDGRYWTYNSIQKWWEENFDFWSLDTVKRCFKSLEKKGILITGNYNKDSRDRTKWYSIDYEKLEGIRQCISAKCPNGELQNAPMRECKMPQPLPETSTETSTEISSKDKCIKNSQDEKCISKNDSKETVEDIPYAEIVEYLNSKAETKYRATAESTRSKIKARWNEGFKLNDFKKVIDNKVLDWKGNFTKDGVPLSNFLRPETLFGTKFESYLNQKINAENSNSNSSQSTFNNFKQRNYDFKELEKKLLGIQ